MENINFQVTQRGDVLCVTGAISAERVRGLVTAMNADNIRALDFAGVTEISFAALRVLLQFGKTKKRLSIINADESVLEMIEASGVGVFLNVTRKPMPLVLTDYVGLADGMISKAYCSKDGDRIVKVYESRVPAWKVAHERTMARAAAVMGVNTPLPGALYEVDGRMAVSYERIEGKRSFSRIIEEEPDRIDEVAAHFARMAKELHSTECDTLIFGDVARRLHDDVLRCGEISESVKDNALRFIDSIPAATTCLHGKMELSNAITSPQGDDLWIDMGDFGYGNRMLDLGMLYFQCHDQSEELLRFIFHLSKEQMARVWDSFACEYFGSVSTAAMNEVCRSLRPYGALAMLSMGMAYGFEPSTMTFIKEVFE